MVEHYIRQKVTDILEVERFSGADVNEFCYGILYFVAKEVPESFTFRPNNSWVLSAPIVVGYLKDDYSEVNILGYIPAKDIQILATYEDAWVEGLSIYSNSLIDISTIAKD